MSNLVLTIHILQEAEYEKLAKASPVGTEIYAQAFSKDAIKDSFMARMVGDNASKIMVRTVKAALLKQGSLLDGGKKL